MSDRLDDLFRNSMNEVPPATPPAGQWELISKQRLAVPLTTGWGRGWFLALGLLLGLGLGAPMGGYLLTSDCPGETEIPLMTQVNKTVVSTSTPGVAPVPSPAHSTIIAPAAAPRKKPSSPSSYKETSPTRSSVAIFPAETETGQYMLRPDSLVAMDKIIDPSLSDASDSRILQLRERSLPAKDIGKNDAFTLARLRRPDKLPSISSPVIGKVKREKTGKWEFSGHLTPWLSDANKHVGIYTETPGDGTPRTLDFNGGTVDLYAKKQLNINLIQRPRLLIANFEFARQFGNGLRIGLGLGWQPSHNDNIRNEEEYFNSQLLESEWAVYGSVESETLRLGLSAGYTFRRTKLLRPYLGLYLGSRFYVEHSLKQNIFRRSDGRQDFEFIVEARNSGKFNDLYFMPQAGLQYQIREHFSIGLEVVPGIGLGGRWRF